MHAISQSTDSERDARCIHASKRVRWDIDEHVIREVPNIHQIT
jgi:hypothetical protein